MMLTMALSATYTDLVAPSANGSEKGEPMKILLLSFLLAAAAVLAPAADNASLSGKWQVHASAGGNESDQACTFTHKADDLTGSCTSDRGTVQIAGKVDEKNVTWTYKSEYNGSPLTVTFKGKLDSPAKITGTVRAEEFGIEGEFTATQSQ